nr:hypothetical protein [Candidatus Brocadiia bacterium]
NFFVGLRREVAPRVLARLRESEKRIERLLTPGQRDKWRAVVARLKKDWLPVEMTEREPGGR